ncbi:hypothetical protein PQO01_05205 [Lentisphaera marina]|uniref:hypothetical protein n=1 Tax=Lentisphaera marina TaxID=1111041 RepID=UPI002365F29B|nr:hypothetical protein [Lentisphaera marina]MDD7984343.1 hypothetical protein [Lentisphaera marina]
MNQTIKDTIILQDLLEEAIKRAYVLTRRHDCIGAFTLRLTCSDDRTIEDLEDLIEQCLFNPQIEPDFLKLFAETLEDYTKFNPLIKMDYCYFIYESEPDEINILCLYNKVGKQNEPEGIERAWPVESFRRVVNIELKNDFNRDELMRVLYQSFVDGNDVEDYVDAHIRLPYNDLTNEEIDYFDFHEPDFLTAF